MCKPATDSGSETPQCKDNAEADRLPVRGQEEGLAGPQRAGKALPPQLRALRPAFQVGGLQIQHCIAVVWVVYRKWIGATKCRLGRQQQDLPSSHNLLGMSYIVTRGTPAIC